MSSFKIYFILYKSRVHTLREERKCNTTLNDFIDNDDMYLYYTSESMIHNKLDLVTLTN